MIFLMKGGVTMQDRMKKSVITTAIAILMLLVATPSSAAPSLLGDIVSAQIFPTGQGSIFGETTHYVAQQFTSPKTVWDTGSPEPEFCGLIAANNYQNSDYTGTQTYSFANVCVDVSSDRFTVYFWRDAGYAPTDAFNTFHIGLSDLDWKSSETGQPLPNTKITGLNCIHNTIQTDEGWESFISPSGTAVDVGFYGLRLGSGDSVSATFVFLTEETSPPSSQALSNGVTATNISQSKGNWRSYYIDVPAGMQTLAIQTWGGTGDADLYVRRGSLPTLSSWDYRSWNYGNDETITITNPVSGRYYISLYGYTAFSGVSLRATYSAGPTALTNGATVTGISGSKGSYREFYIDVPAGASSLMIETWGGTGDADLYVRRGSLPTLSSWDYRSWNDGNNETIPISNPASGRYYISLYGYTAFSGVSLRANYSAGHTELTNGVALTNLSGTTTTMTYYYIDVPSGQATLTIGTWGGTGDADLYVRYGSVPTTSSYGYRSWNDGNVETIPITNPTSGRWYIGLHAYSTFSNVSLRATYATGPLALSNGVPVTNISGAAGSMKYYLIYVPSGQSSLSIQTSGGTGDADLYVRYGSVPTTSSYGYRSWNDGNAETITITNPSSGYWYIGLHAYSTYSGLSLLATYSSGVTPTQLSNGVPVTSLGGAMGSWKHYYIDVPAGQGSLTVQTWGGTGDCDLYVKVGSVPSTTSYDYRPWLPGNRETVTINNPTSGRYYIGLHGYSAYSGVTLRAAISPYNALVNNEAVTNLSGGAGTWKTFIIVLPGGLTNMTVQTWGGAGDCDLYVKYLTMPTLTSWDYRPWLPGNNETVSIPNPGGFVWWVRLYGYSGYSGVSLKASYY
jgi:large repetitive protein